AGDDDEVRLHDHDGETVPAEPAARTGGHAPR
ncbi:hypothetical protein ES5_17368, partial [Dietzia cinnamea P4]